MFTSQLAQSRALLGDRLTLYQVHSLTVDSGLFTDAALLAALSRLRAEGVIIGLSASGPHQAETIRRALPVTIDGQQLFTATEVTWNLLEPSVGLAAAEAAAAGWAVLIKEAVANGRLTAAGGPPAPLTALAAAHGVTEDAIALAAALAQPWASVVLSGAVTRAQLDENLAALGVGQLPALSLAEAPTPTGRSGRPGHGTELLPSPPPGVVTVDRAGRPAPGSGMQGPPRPARRTPHTPRTGLGAAGAAGPRSCQCGQPEAVNSVTSGPAWWLAGGCGGLLAA